MKENNAPLFVNTKSNHPPRVLKNIPLGLNRRLSRISANQTLFDAASPVYQEAQAKSGYDQAQAAAKTAWQLVEMEPFYICIWKIFELFQFTLFMPQYV